MVQLLEPTLEYINFESVWKVYIYSQRYLFAKSLTSYKPIDSTLVTAADLITRALRYVPALLIFAKSRFQAYCVLL